MIFNQTLSAQGGGGDVSAEFAALNPTAEPILAVVEESARTVFVYAVFESSGEYTLPTFYVPSQYAIDTSFYTDGMYWGIVNGGGTIDTALWDDSQSCFPLDEISTDFGGTCYFSASWQY